MIGKHQSSISHKKKKKTFAETTLIYRTLHRRAHTSINKQSGGWDLSIVIHPL